MTGRSVLESDFPSVAAAFPPPSLEEAFCVLEEHIGEGSEDELVCRSLIDACGRCGEFDRAIVVLGLMQQAGYRPDSLVYLTVLHAFSLAGESSSSMRSETAAMLQSLDWTNLRSEGEAAPEAGALPRGLRRAGCVSSAQPCEANDPWIGAESASRVRPPRQFVGRAVSRTRD